MDNSSQSGAAPSSRRRDLDRLRIAACLLLFPFHTLQVFDLHAAYHIKSATQLMGLEMVSRAINAWHMPLFFMLSGMAAMYALRSHTPRDFLMDRVGRLLPPLILGLVTIAPIIKYFERLGGRDMTYEGVEIIPNWLAPSFPTFLLQFFSDIDVFSWSHLWYLAYLLLFTAVVLPALVWLQTKAQLDEAWAAHWMIWLPLPLLIAIELWLRPIWGDIHSFIYDWANIPIFLLLLLSGATLVRFPVLERQLNRQWGYFGILGASGLALMLSSDHVLLVGVGRACANFGAIGALIGGAPLLFARTWPYERYLATAQLPIYVLHHLPLIVLAYFMRDLPWPVAVRMVVIMGGAVLITFAFYHVAVRPVQGWLADRRLRDRAVPAE
jgi:glucans biosynthesis protein C